MFRSLQFSLEYRSWPLLNEKCSYSRTLRLWNINFRCAIINDERALRDLGLDDRALREPQNQQVLRDHPGSYFDDGQDIFESVRLASFISAKMNLVLDLRLNL